MKHLYIVRVKSQKHGWRRNCFWYDSPEAANAAVEMYVDIGVPRENVRVDEYYSSKAGEA